MGGDGGSIPGRADLVRHKKQAERVDPEVLLSIYWKLCALSEEPLRSPIVACELGRLYNKEAVLNYLLSKDDYSPDKQAFMAHVRSLKDVFTLNLSPAADDSCIGACPVTNLQMNGKHKFVFIKSCGCVISERCLREVPSETCQRCNKPFVESDVVHINPPKAEADALRIKLLERKKAEKAEKAAKKTKSKEPGSADDAPKQSVKRKAEEEAERPRNVAPALDPAMAAQLKERMDQIKGNSALKNMFGDKTKKKEGNFVSRTFY